MYICSIHAMMAHRENSYIATLRLTPGARWSWVFCITGRLLFPLGKNTVAHWSKGWVGPRACLGLFEHEKIPAPAGIRTAFPPGRSLLVPTTLPGNVFYWNRGIYHVHQNPSPVPILSQMNSLYTLPFDLSFRNIFYLSLRQTNKTSCHIPWYGNIRVNLS